MDYLKTLFSAEKLIMGRCSVRYSCRRFALRNVLEFLHGKGNDDLVELFILVLFKFKRFDANF